jgi:putative pyruvate formate lyase activating enzyme
MPGGLAGTAQVVRFLAQQLSPHAYLNVMAQYAPAGKVGPGHYDEINRPVTRDEVSQALAQAHAAGLCRLDSRA